MKMSKKKMTMAIFCAVFFAMLLFIALYAAVFSQDEQKNVEELPTAAESPVGTEGNLRQYQDPDAVKSLVIDCYSLEETHPEPETGARSMALSVVSQTDREYTGIDDWYYNNKLYLPMIGMEWDMFFDDDYIYRWKEEYDHPSLIICDRQTGIQLYEVVITTRLLANTANNAYLKDGVLYAGCIVQSEDDTNTNFMFAYDLENDRLLWRSRENTYSSRNFIVKDGVIICGFGGTDEPDYIYQIDMDTGEVLSETPVSSAPYLLVESGGQLYVNTYENDYVFDMS